MNPKTVPEFLAAFHEAVNRVAELETLAEETLTTAEFKALGDLLEDLPA